MTPRTGVTKDNQTLVVDARTAIPPVQPNQDWKNTFFTYGINDITCRSVDFVAKRRWEHHDTTMNLILSLCSEAGELADVVAWKGEQLGANEISDIRDKIAQELADVIIVLVRFAKKNNIQVCNHSQI